MASGCASDRDCPGTRICYNVSWTGFQATCLCSTWFGFSGSDCQDSLQTSTALWRFITAIFLIVGWIIAILIGTYEVRRLAKFRKEWSVTHTCQLQLLSGSILCCLAEILGVVTLV